MAGKRNKQCLRNDDSNPIYHRDHELGILFHEMAIYTHYVRLPPYYDPLQYVVGEGSSGPGDNVFVWTSWGILTRDDTAINYGAEELCEAGVY